MFYTPNSLKPIISWFIQFFQSHFIHGYCNTKKVVVVIVAVVVVIVLLVFGMQASIDHKGNDAPKYCERYK